MRSLFFKMLCMVVPMLFLMGASTITAQGSSGLGGTVADHQIAYGSGTSITSSALLTYNTSTNYLIYNDRYFAHLHNSGNFGIGDATDHEILTADILTTSVIIGQGNTGTLLKFNRATGADAWQVLTNGARSHFGAGASDYASSDGTTVTFAGPLATAGTLTFTGNATGTTHRGTIVLAGGTGTATVVSGAVCVCSTDTAFLACQPSVSGTTLTTTVTGGGTNTVSYVCL